MARTAGDYGLEVGRSYRSRKGSRSPDREIIWISNDGTRVQYDGDAVKLGRRFPVVSADAFAKWAGIEEGL